MIDLVEMNVLKRWKAQWAHSVKSIYYSFYMDVTIKKLIPAFGNVQAVLYGTIYATTLTTSSLGWKYGREYAILKNTMIRTSLLTGLMGSEIIMDIWVMDNIIEA